VKLNNQTKTYNTVRNDNLSPTMHAFYFCNKSRVILSDKEAAALSSMNIDNNNGNGNYDDDEENNVMSNSRFKRLSSVNNGLQPDAFSNQSPEGSVNGLSFVNNSNIKDSPRLKRKRRNSTRLTRKDRKAPRHNLKPNIFDNNDNEESFINQNLLLAERDKDINMEGDEDDEEEQNNANVKFYINS
jgi:hypothetical protein